MLYELVEVAKDCLTEQNLPSDLCPICLTVFMVSESCDSHMMGWSHDEIKCLRWSQYFSISSLWAGPFVMSSLWVCPGGG